MPLINGGLMVGLQNSAGVGNLEGSDRAVGQPGCNIFASCPKYIVTLRRGVNVKPPMNASVGGGGGLQPPT